VVIEEKVQAALAADAGVRALVPGVIRVGFVGQGVATPYIGHQPVTSSETRTHSGRAGIQEWEYQISCFAGDYPTAKAIAIAVQNLFNNFSSADLQTTRSTLGPHIREDEVGISQIPVLLTVWDTF
jgi:hypothetical protein